jgi:riboflavin kinase / FMN adenylyltransferase
MMQVFRSISEVPADFGLTVLSVGNFDGVHRAHQKVIAALRKRAGELHARSLIVTFDPHPTRVLRPGMSPKVITPLSKKLELLASSSVDAVLVFPFTREFSKTTAKEFAEILGKQLHAKEVHEGFNFHFGHKAEGNLEKLTHLGKDAGFTVVSYPEMRLRGNSVSSSRIRELVSAGNVSTARALLGRTFSIAAHPAKGRGYGKQYTVPTVNLSVYEELVPGTGVYITRTRVGDKTFDSVTNVGNRPTFGADSFAIESHLLDFTQFDLSEDTLIETCFLHRLRDEIKFPSVEHLRAQIGRDVARAQRYFRLL